MKTPNSCAADQYCQLQSDQLRSGMITCNHCLQVFHHECVFFLEPESRPEHWTCGTMFSEIE